MLLYEDHKAVVYALAFSPDGSALASGGRDGSVFLRDSLGDRHPLAEPGPNSRPIQAITYTPDGSAVVIGGEFGWLGRRNDNGVWKVFGPMNAPPVATPAVAGATRKDGQAGVTSLAMLDDRTLAVGIGDRGKGTPGKFELWDIVSGRKRPDYFYEPNGVRAVAACPAKRTAAWVTGHMKVRVWEVIRSHTIDFPQPKPCHAVALSPDGSQLAVALDHWVRVYTIADGSRRPRMELKGHKGQVSSVAFSADGRTIATGSWDFTVKLWDAATGLERETFRWDIGRVYCLTYAPDGLRLAAGGDTGKVVVWDME